MLKIEFQKNLQQNILLSASLQAETGLREMYVTHTKNFKINNQPSSHWFLRKLVCELYPLFQDSLSNMWKTLSTGC